MFGKKNKVSIIKKITAAICACGFLACLGLSTAKPVVQNPITASASESKSESSNDPTLTSATDTASPVAGGSTTTTPEPTEYQTYIDVEAINKNMSSLINSDTYVYNVKKDDIKKIIYRNTIRQATGFRPSDVMFDSTKPNNGFSVNGETGYITVWATLSSYKDATGTEVLGGFPPQKIVFGPYRPVPGPTTLNKQSVDCADPEVIPSQIYTDTDYLNKKLVASDAVLNVPETATFTLSGLKFSNTEGYVSCSLFINGWFNNDKIFIAQPRLLKDDFRFTGFKRLVATNIPTTLEMPGVKDELAVSYVSKFSAIREFIFNNLTPRLPTMKVDDITIDLVTAKNDKGELVVNFSYRNVYKNESVPNTANADKRDVIISDVYSSFNGLIITGFKAVTPTVFPDEIPLTGMKYTLAQDIKEDQIKEYLLKTINNNIGITNNDIIFDNLLYNNIGGFISVVPKLDKFVDSKGMLYDIDGDYRAFPEVRITGFREVLPTEVNAPDNNELGNNKVLPSDAFNGDIDSIKEIIKNNFLSNMPDDFDASRDIIINPVKSSYDNLSGTIFVVFQLSNYYEPLNGLLIKTPSTSKYTAIIKGYKSSSKTLIKRQVNIDGMSDKLATSFTDAELLDYVKKNIDDIATPLPPDFNVETNIVLNQINAYNTTGEIKAFIELSCFFNSLGLEVTTDVTYTDITFTGFKAVNPTQIQDDIYLKTVSDVAASDVDEARLKKLVLDTTNPANPTSELIVNMPSTFKAENLMLNITNRISNSVESYIVADVSLSTYYNDEGVLVQDSNIFRTKEGVKFYGFKKVHPTTVKQTVKVPASSRFARYYPSDLTPMTPAGIDPDKAPSVEAFVQENMDLFFDNYPDGADGLYVKDVVIKTTDNLNGTLIVDLSILNYYDAQGKTETTIPKTTQIKITNLLPVGETQAAVSRYPVPSKYETILPTQVTNNDIINILFENKQFIFTSLPLDFKKNDISLSLTPSSYRNTLGEIDVKVILNNYFDAFGQQQRLIPKIMNITLTGFNQIQKTEINSEFTNTDSALANVLPSNVTSQELLNFIYENKNTLFVSLPKDFEMSDIYIDQNAIQPNNYEGSITIQPLVITKFYDINGVLVDNDPNNVLSKAIIIRGFGHITGMTQISSTTNIKDLPYSTLLPTQVDIKIVKEVAYGKHLMAPVPDNFSILDIVSTNADIVSADNLTGQVVVNLKIKNYYDDLGNVSNSLNQELSQEVTISGFKQIFATASKDVSINGISNLIASQVSKNELLDIICDNYLNIFDLKSLPPSFSQANITDVNVVGYNNKNGSINVAVKLNYFYADDGSVVANGSTKDFYFKIDGFKQIIPTTITNNEIKLWSMATRLASDLSNFEIVSLIYENIKDIFANLPETNFTQDDIIINSFKADNLSGKIRVDMSLTYYVDEHGNYIDTTVETSKPNLNAVIFLSGFKQIGETKIRDSYTVQGQNAKKLPSSMKESDIITLIVSDPKAFIDNPYSVSSEIINDIIVTNLQPNNSNGTLTFVLSVTKYYDVTGKVVLNGTPLEKTVLLKGFISQPSTVFETAVDLESSDSLPIPQKVTNEQLKNLIYENRIKFFKNLPSNFRKDNISIATIVSHDNLTGTLVVRLSIYNYVDSKGIVQNITPYTYNVTISGFKKILPTNIIGDVKIENFSGKNNIPSYFYLNSAKLKDLIISNKRSIFENVPTEVFETTAFNTNLKIVPVSFDNTVGSLVVNISLDEYYNEEGEFVNNGVTLAKNVKLSGFMTSHATKILQDKPILANNAASSGLPSTISKEKARDILVRNYNNFIINLPPSFNASTNIDNITVMNTNDIEGTVTIKFSIDLYYNDNSEIVGPKKDLKWGVVTFYGFKSVKPSGFINPKGDTEYLGTFERININYESNVLPSQIDYFYTRMVTGPTLPQQREKVDKFLYDIVATRLVNLYELNETNVQVNYREQQFSDEEGYVEASVTVLKYASIEEGGANANPCQFVVRIYGFEKQLTSVNVVNQTVVVSAIVLGAIALLAGACLIGFVFKFKVWRRGV